MSRHDHLHLSRIRSLVELIAVRKLPLSGSAYALVFARRGHDRQVGPALLFPLPGVLEHSRPLHFGVLLRVVRLKVLLLLWMARHQPFSEVVLRASGGVAEVVVFVLDLPPLHDIVGPQLSVGDVVAVLRLVGTARIPDGSVLAGPILEVLGVLLAR